MKFNFNRASINYIQITYKLSDSTLCSCKTSLRDADDKTVILSCKFDDELKLTSNTEVVMDIVCNDGLYRAKTRLKYTTKESPYLYLFLENPSDIVYQQNREFFRVEEVFECLCIIKENGELRQYKSETIDISANGVSLLFTSKIVVENPVNLILKINNKELRITARLVRTENYGKFYKISFTYTKILESDRDYISQYCIQKQLIERRNLLK